MEPSTTSYAFIAVVVLSLVLGIMVVIPIGGADMPVVISLLNAYSGLAACAAGFAINNNILIVAGSLVGAAGMILTNIMCKAMNRSLANVLFSGFGAVKTATAPRATGSITARWYEPDRLHPLGPGRSRPCSNRLLPRGPGPFATKPVDLHR